ncbi:pyridoxal phosphate-dependent aminotransferase [Rhodococcus sp. NPDC057529]|uniref:pyridoxal phosphate-dependent aminotransferase n=1 Tax=Rhodococcus sp. NPDC057529 TaxID=3346158 RepID=UPI003671CF3D
MTISFTPSAAVDRVARTSKRPAMGPAPAGAVSLAMGEPDFDTPAPIVHAAETALRAGETHYADQNGLPRLREALAAKLSAQGVRDFGASEVLVSHGATAGLAAVITAAVGPGDRVVIPEPCYSLYADLVQLAGGEPVLVPPASDMHWDLDKLRHALVGAKMIVFSNPCNPTGIVHTQNELIALGEILKDTDTLVLSDEAYDVIVYEPTTFVSALAIESLRDRTIYCQTLSKTYAMTGWRIGYVAGPTDVIAAASRVHRTFNGSVNSSVQVAACAALETDQRIVDDMVASYRDRRDLLLDRLAAIPQVTSYDVDGTFYSFVRYNADRPSEHVTAELREAGLIVRAGAEYGPSGEGHIRLSFAADSTSIGRAADILQQYFASVAPALESSPV